MEAAHDRVLVWNAAGFERPIGDFGLVQLLALWDASEQPYVAGAASNAALALDRVLEHVSDELGDDESAYLYGSVPALNVRLAGERPSLAVWCLLTSKAGRVLVACESAILPGLPPSWEVSTLDGHVTELPLGVNASRELAHRWGAE